MRWCLIGLLLLLLGCGADSEPTRMTSGPPVFERIEEGTGEPNTEPVWPLNVGSYVEKAFSVESRQAGIYRVLVLGTNRRVESSLPVIEDVQRWAKTDDGLAFVSSRLDGRPTAPLIILPPTIREGMSWRTSDEFVAIVSSRSVAPQPTLVGLRTLWTVTLTRDDVLREFVFAEGVGPWDRPGSRGVIVISDDSEAENTFELPEAVVSVPFDETLESAEPGIYELGAVDLNGGFVFVARSSFVPFGAGFRTAGGDHCYVVEAGGELRQTDEGPDGGALTSRDCPVRQISGRGGSALVVAPPMIIPHGSGLIDWIPASGVFGRVSQVTSLPHLVDGDVRYFIRNQRNTSTMVGLNDGQHERIYPDIEEEGYRTTHNGLYDELESALRIGLDYDSETRPLRFLTVVQSWVTANTLQGSQPGPSHESWFIPGRASVRTSDEGREVFLSRPDGVVLRVNTQGTEVHTSLVAHAQPLEIGPYTGAVRHPTGVALSVEVPLFRSRATPPIPFVKVPPLDTDIALSPAFAFRVSVWTGDTFLVCFPRRLGALADLRLRANGLDAIGIDQSEYPDGCGLVSFSEDIPRGTSIEATLPGVGTVFAYTENIGQSVGSGR